MHPRMPSMSRNARPASKLAVLAVLLLASANASAQAEEPPPSPAPDAFGGDFAPTFDDEEDGDDAFGGDFAPSFDDEEEDHAFGGDYAPSFDDEDDDDAFGGDFAPSFDDDEPASPSVPAPSVAAPSRTSAPVDEDDDAYYEQMWLSLDAAADAEVAEEAPDTIEVGLGRIEGTIRDDEFGGPMADASVTLEELNRTLVTGESGAFFFDVPPGTYTVRVRGLGYQSRAFQIEVEAEEVSTLGGIRMREDTDSAMTMEVEGRMDRQGAAAQLVQRQQSATTRDAISAEQISKTGDSSASDAARRVVGVTMLEDRYAVIRGLQGRYNQVLLNGIPVMVLNPAYPAAELDLFPSSLLASMAVNKVPTATLPGDFAGGLLEIETGDFAEEFEMNLSVGTSVDTRTAFQDFYRYRGSGTDFLGFDNGRRGLPDSFQGQVMDTDNGLTRDQINERASELSNVWNPTSRLGMVGLSLGAGMSDTIELENGSRMSYRLNLVYKNAPKTRHDVVGGITSGDVAPFYQDKDSYTTEVTWGTLGAVRYDFDDDNEVSLVLASTVLSENNTSFINGLNSENIIDKRRELTFSTQRALNVQLFGEHRDVLNTSTINWAAAVAQGRNYAPDHRFATFTSSDASDTPVLSQQPGSSERYFQDMTQSEVTARFDWTFHLGEGFYRRNLAIGGLARSANRDYEARRFRYLRARGQDASNFTGDLEDILAPGNLGTLVNFTEATDREGRDSYLLDQFQLSTYLMSDIEVNDWFRFAAGARLESFSQKMDMAGDKYDGERTDLDILPSGSLIFRMNEKQAIRAAYGASVARPQGHEFAATILQDYQRRRQLQGNPDLERTYIHNVDLRYEFFPSSTEVFAATLFYKHFTNHIEDVIVSRNGSLRSQNIPQAQDLGLELELQLDLERIHDRLRGLSLATNFSYVFSRVKLSDSSENLYTSAKRPMSDQSPYMANVLLSYEHARSGWQLNLVYNVLGRTLVDVGAVTIPDTYRETVHTLDVNARWAINDHWKLSISIDDLIPTSVRYTVGKFDRDIQQRATAVGVGVGWSY